MAESRAGARVRVRVRVAAAAFHRRRDRVDAPFQLVLSSALAALRQARLNVSFSCQQGFCGTCVQTVVSGEVEHRDHALTGEQRASGQMLVCVSRSANGPLVLDL